MTDSLYTIRNYQPADFNKYILLCQEAAGLKLGERPVSSGAIAEKLARPDYSPGRDLFVVEATGSLVGYMDLKLESGIGRVVLDCWLSPQHRGKGLATKLLDGAMYRAREVRAGVLHVNIMEDNALAKAVLSRLGFEHVRRFFEFKLDMTGLNWQEANHTVQECCKLRHGEEAKLTRIQNLSFVEHWGYNPNTLETTTYRINHSNCAPEDVFLAYEEDKVIGFCWTETYGKQEGRIFMLGVDPDNRGKGVGKRLLLAGLAHLRGKGMRVVGLTVDSDNEEACTLYRSAGFEFCKGSLWYERAVTQDTGAG
ncbi:GNAT family N-acetyltransferase [Chloroflexota bacterium]